MLKLLFLDYEKFKIGYHAAQTQYNDLLNEKEALFTMTQPRSVRYDIERVSGGEHDDSFAQYLIKKEQLKLDERIDELRTILEARAELMDIKLDELKGSKDILDRVYWQRFILRKKVSEISILLNYSEPQVYRFIKTIKDMIAVLYYSI